MVDRKAFDKKHSTLTGCTPFFNAIKLQGGIKIFTLMVSDGGAIGNVITMIGNSNT